MPRALPFSYFSTPQELDPFRDAIMVWVEIRVQISKTLPMLQYLVINIINHPMKHAETNVSRQNRIETLRVTSG